jgi:hypothetical protein
MMTPAISELVKGFGTRLFFVSVGDAAVIKKCLLDLIVTARSQRADRHVFAL